jgi:hypothetical protein
VKFFDETYLEKFRLQPIANQNKGCPVVGVAELTISCRWQTAIGALLTQICVVVGNQGDLSLTQGFCFGNVAFL